MNLISTAKWSLCLSLSMLSLVRGSTGWAAPVDAPIRIALMAALSGEDTSIGAECLRGYQGAASYQRPSDLEFLFGDNHGDPKSAISEFHKLTKIDGAIGVATHLSRIVMPLNPISRAERIPLVGIAGHSEFVVGNPYAFRAWPSAEQEARQLAALSGRLGVRRIALISVEDDYANSIRQHFRRYAERSEVSVVFDQSVERALGNFRPLFGELRNSAADAILINLAVGQGGVFAKQLREQRLSQMIMGNFWSSNSDTIAAAGPHGLEGLYIQEINFHQPKFLEIMRKTDNSEETSPVPFTCFLAARAFVDALQRFGPILNAQQLNDAMDRLDQVRMPDGPIVVVGREAQLELIPKVFRKGKFVDLDLHFRLMR